MNVLDENIAAINELDKLKSVYRKSYLSDGSRLENSAEHSWQLAMTFMAMKHELPKALNVDHAIKLALAHDVCEIGPGDVCAYHDQTNKQKSEQDYLEKLKARFPEFGADILKLWYEYEAQETIESHWVKVFDKLLPFLLNIANEGRTWQEQQITAGMVRDHNRFIGRHAPAIYNWMVNELELAMQKGWLSE